MKIICALIVLCLILLFNSYSQTLVSQPRAVAKVSHVPSMTYSQWHLLAHQFDSQPVNVESGVVLMQRHCGLIRLGLVKTEPLVALCEPAVSRDVQLCVAKLHRCIASCDAAQRDCPVCEFKAGRCLESVDSGLRRNDGEREVDAGEKGQGIDSGPAQAALSRGYTTIHLAPQGTFSCG